MPTYLTGRRRRTPVAGMLFLLLTSAAQLTAQEPARVLTLDQAIRLAVEADPAAVAAEGQVANARTDVLQATGLWLPNLNFSSAYANSSNQRFDQATGQLVSQSYTAQLQGGYDIFTGGRRFMEMRSSNADLAAADAQYDSQRYTTTLNTTIAYYGAAAATDIAAWRRSGCSARVRSSPRRRRASSLARRRNLMCCARSWKLATLNPRSSMRKHRCVQRHSSSAVARASRVRSALLLRRCPIPRRRCHRSRLWCSARRGSRRP